MVAAAGQAKRRVASSGKLLTTISGRYVRHCYFTLAGKIRRACDQLLHLGGDAHPLRRRQRRDKTGRKHTINDDVFGWTGVAVQKARFGRRSKARSWKYSSPLLRVKPRSVALIGVKDTPQVSDPLHAFVANIPDKPENAACLQDPADFVERLWAGEPVKGLRTDDGIEAGVG